jgi:hypothetical protein
VALNHFTVPSDIVLPLFSTLYIACGDLEGNLQ